MFHSYKKWFSIILAWFYIDDAWPSTSFCYRIKSGWKLYSVADYHWKVLKNNFSNLKDFDWQPCLYKTDRNFFVCHFFGFSSILSSSSIVMTFFSTPSSNSRFNRKITSEKLWKKISYWKFSIENDDEFFEWKSRFHV